MDPAKIFGVFLMFKP